VLKPGGRATLLSWGPMQQPYFEITVGTVLRCVPGLALPPSGAAMFKFGGPGALTAALRSAGFAHVQEDLRELPWNWPDAPEELWAYFQEVTIPFKPLFEAVPPERRGEVEAEVLRQFRERYDGKAVNLMAKVVLASAVK
jgi:hypothetical protein